MFNSFQFHYFRATYDLIYLFDCQYIAGILKYKNGERINPIIYPSISHTNCYENLRENRTVTGCSVFNYRTVTGCSVFDYRTVTDCSVFDWPKIPQLYSTGKILFICSFTCLR